MHSLHEPTSRSLLITAAKQQKKSESRTRFEWLSSVSAATEQVDRGRTTRHSGWMCTRVLIVFSFAVVAMVPAASAQPRTVFAARFVNPPHPDPDVDIRNQFGLGSLSDGYLALYEVRGGFVHARGFASDGTARTHPTIIPRGTELACGGDTCLVVQPGPEAYAFRLGGSGLLDSGYLPLGSIEFSDVLIAYHSAADAFVIVWFDSDRGTIARWVGADGTVDDEYVASLTPFFTGVTVACGTSGCLLSARQGAGGELILIDRTGVVATETHPTHIYNSVGWDGSQFIVSWAGDFASRLNPDLSERDNLSLGGQLAARRASTSLWCISGGCGGTLRSGGSVFIGSDGTVSAGSLGEFDYVACLSSSCVGTRDQSAYFLSGARTEMLTQPSVHSGFQVPRGIGTAVDGAEGMVVWTEEQGTNDALWVQPLVDLDVTASALELSDGTEGGAISRIPGTPDFLVAWDGRASLVSPDASTTEVLPIFPRSVPSLAAGAREHVLLDEDSLRDVRASIVSATGTASSPTTVGRGSGMEYEVAVGNSDALVVWSASGSILAARVGLDGSLIDSTPISISPSLERGRVAWLADHYLVAWPSDDGVVGVRVTDGSVDELVPVTLLSDVQWNEFAVGSDDAFFWVAGVRDVGTFPEVGEGRLVVARLDEELSAVDAEADSVVDRWPGYHRTTGLTATKAANGNGVIVSYVRIDPTIGVAARRVALAYVDSGLAQGDACAAPGDCETSQCVDGVCCDTECAEACGTCLESLGAPADGTCGARNDAFVCRDSTSACDPVEECDGVALSCPPDISDCMMDAGSEGMDVGLEDADTSDAGGGGSGGGCSASGKSANSGFVFAFVLVLWSVRRRWLAGTGA